MKDVGLNVVKAIQFLAEKKDHPLRIVECGTIRNPSFEGHADGLGTYHVARWLKEQAKAGKFHEFFSFELSEGILRGCREFLRENGKLDAFVSFGLGDAALLLEHFRLPIDVCYLDAGADPIENLEQYRLAEKWMRDPGIIIIDDVFDPKNADRGLVTVPYARMEGRKVACLDGRQALILFGFNEYPLSEGSHWL